MTNGVNSCEIHIGPTRFLRKLCQQKLPAWTTRNRKNVKLKEAPNPHKFYYQADKNIQGQTLATFHEKGKDDSEGRTKSPEGINKYPEGRFESHGGFLLGLEAEARNSDWIRPR